MCTYAICSSVSFLADNQSPSLPPSLCPLLVYEIVCMCMSLYVSLCISLCTTDSTVHDLLSHHGPALDSHPKPLHPPFTLSNWWTLHDAARFMVLHHVHRIWVVAPPSDTDAAEDRGLEGGQEARVVLREGLGVLTITDILRAIYLAE